MEIWMPNRKCNSLKEELIDLAMAYRDWILRRGYYGNGWTNRKEVGVGSEIPLKHPLIASIRRTPSPTILHQNGKSELPSVVAPSLPSSLVSP